MLGHSRPTPLCLGYSARNESDGMSATIPSLEPASYHPWSEIPPATVPVSRPRMWDSPESRAVVGSIPRDARDGECRIKRLP